jgi:hypothetical protein
MTFQLNYNRKIEENNRLQLLYDIEGELPGCKYELRNSSFNSNGYTFKVRVSVTGEFILETDQNYSKRLGNNGILPIPSPVDPLEILGERLHKHIQDEFETLEKLTENQQLTLNDV